MKETTDQLVYVQLERSESLWLYARILQTCYSATYIYTSIYTYFDFWPFNVFLYTVLLRPCNWSVGMDFWDLMIPTLISDPCSIFAAKVALVDDVNAGVLDEKTVDTKTMDIFKSIEIASEWLFQKGICWKSLQKYDVIKFIVISWYLCYSIELCCCGSFSRYTYKIDIMMFEKVMAHA